MFTPDGELRPEFRDLDDAPPDPAPPPTGGDAPSSASSANIAPDPDFVEMVESLATSAFAAMGLLSPPGSGEAPDLNGARRIIDWLNVLERKTGSNLNLSERDLLSRALYELRMAFVKLSTPPGTAPAAR